MISSSLRLIRHQTSTGTSSSRPIGTRIGKILLRCLSSTRSGTVKFYIREKGYGFIQPDGGGADVFVHRSGFVTDVPIDVSIQNPFLRKGERVRFATIPDTGLEKAVQVRWLDGSTIPPVRKNYLGSVHERARRVLGEHCYTIMSDADLSDEEKAQKVRDAFDYAQIIVKNGESLIERLGLKVEDFPIHAERNQTGRYRFSATTDDDDSAADDGQHQQDENQTTAGAGRSE